MIAPSNRPLAAKGLTSYRCRSSFGWVMIAATDHDDAMREAARSTASPQRETLEIWDGAQYVPVSAQGEALDAASL